mmetsp:Transcript_37964/g.97992  ORF Transcript_37964/g.97992 Transcript_37964/m.97992 type:complete len:100 (-) Transcript_37964:1697-1996(-)
MSVVQEVRQAVRRTLVRLPNMPMAMMKDDKAREQGFVALKTLPRFTKPEIKGYLEAIYNVTVKDIKTVNVTGEYQELQPTGRRTRKIPSYKKVFVKIEE